MHHSGGAAAETVYIYGQAIDHALQMFGENCQTCVVGLGLGYIEIAWAVRLIKKGFSPSKELFFQSFETVSELKLNFKTWLESDGFHPIYDLIVSKLESEISINEIKKILVSALKNGSVLLGDISLSQPLDLKSNLICYDAFSRKTNEGLWSFEFLDFFLKNHCAKNCVFTTYACTVNLRKSLVENGFEFTKRPGFGGKRESTYAERSANEITTPRAPFFV